MSKRCDAEERWQNCERAYCQQFMKCSVAASSEPVSKLSVTSPAPTPSQQEAFLMAVDDALSRPDEVTK